MLPKSEKRRYKCIIINGYKHPNISNRHHLQSTSLEHLYDSVHSQKGALLSEVTLVNVCCCCCLMSLLLVSSSWWVLLLLSSSLLLMLLLLLLLLLLFLKRCNLYSSNNHFVNNISSSLTPNRFSILIISKTIRVCVNKDW